MKQDKKKTKVIVCNARFIYYKLTMECNTNKSLSKRQSLVSKEHMIAFVAS